MEMEEPEDEKDGCKVRRWVFNKGLTLGRKILVASFVASSAPLVLPPLVVASAIGLALSTPFAVFYASHACTENLMSKLLPRPTPQGLPLLEDLCFQQNNDLMKEEQALVEEEESPQMHNNVTLEDKLDGDDGNGDIRGESDGEKPIIGGHGVVRSTIEGLDVSENDVEECRRDQAIEGDIDEEELQKGLVEKIRDEGRIDSEDVKYVKGIQGGTNGSGKETLPVVENVEAAEEEKDRSTLVETERDTIKEEDTRTCEEVLQSINAENNDTVYDELVSAEPELVIGILQAEVVDNNTNDSQSQNPMSEHSELQDGRHFSYETTTAESAGDLVIGMQDYDIPIVEDSSEVTSEKTEHMVVEEEPKPLLDGPTTIKQEEKSDSNISDLPNQESQLEENNEIMDSSYGDGREIADGRRFDSFDEKRIDPETNACTIDLDGEPLEVVSSVEQGFRPSESSSGKDIMSPSQEGSPLLEDVSFQRNNDMTKEEQALVEERKRDTKMDDVQPVIVSNEKDVTSESAYGQGVVKEEEEPELSHSLDAIGDIQHEAYFCDEKEEASPQMHNNVTLEDKLVEDYGMEGDIRRESYAEQPMVEGHGVVISAIEGLDVSENDIEEPRTPFEAIEGDIDEELQRETKGLVKKIRDEGRRTDSEDVENVKEIQGGTNENGKESLPDVENVEVAEEEKERSSLVGTEADTIKEEDTRVCEEMLQSINAANKDTIYDEVVSAEPELVIGILEEEVVYNTNDSQNLMSEHSELQDRRHFSCEATTTTAEPVGDLMIGMQDYDIPIVEDSSMVTSEKTEHIIVEEVLTEHIIVQEEPEPLLDGPSTMMQEEKSDSNIYADLLNQESQLEEHNELMDSSYGDAREIADGRGFDSFDEKRIDPDMNACTIDLYEESSSVTVDGHTEPSEVVSSVEQGFRQSESSAGKDIMSPSHEAVLNEESIWKEIHVIRKIIGYEGTIQASYADELKALYIFTGVEPPSFLNENSCDLAEINEKLHFLMSIVGIKSNVA